MGKRYYDELKERRAAPSLAEVNKLMKLVGKKGEKRKEKRELVSRLYDELGVRRTNIQGYDVTDSLEDYEAY